MARFVEHKPHSCGSSDALAIYEEDGKYTGFCYACNKYEVDPYNGKTPVHSDRAEKNEEELKEDVNQIALLPTRPLATRALKKETLEYFGVKTGLSQEDGETPVTSYWPYFHKGELKGYKAKLLPVKQMWSVGDMKGPKDLFGWQQAMRSQAKTLYITEGEEDACALFQAIRERQAGTQYAQWNPAVVSLCNGASGAVRDIKHHLDDINTQFKNGVVLVFDNDEVGQAAIMEVIKLLPLAKTVSFAEKDANEAVVKGHSISLANACLFNAHMPKNTRIVKGGELYEEGRTQAKYGLSYPWEGLTKLTRGMRFGETYYLGAGVKLGKSTIRSALAAHLIKTHGLKVFMAAPEETNKKTYQLMCGQIGGRIFHDPEIPFDYEAYDEAHRTIGENLYLLNLYQHLGWDSLKNDILVAAQEGCKAIFIDPITNLTNGVASSEANTALQGIAQELAAIALDRQLIIWIFCHLKAPDSGDPHERGGKVHSSQFAGSRAMMRSCHMMCSLEGNKDPDLELDLRNQRRFVILEDREFGAAGLIKMHYNTHTGQYAEIKE